jgi:predicted dehydrogenase
MENFVGVIKGRSKGKVSIADAVKTMRVIEGIEVSSNSESWVSLKDI